MACRNDVAVRHGRWLRGVHGDGQPGIGGSVPRRAVAVHRTEGRGGRLPSLARLQDTSPGREVAVRDPASLHCRLVRQALPHGPTDEPPQSTKRSRSSTWRSSRGSSTPPQAASWPRFQLGAIQILVGVAVNGAIIVAAGSVATFLQRKPAWMRWQKWVTGTLLGAISVKLAIDAPAPLWPHSGRHFACRMASKSVQFLPEHPRSRSHPGTFSTAKRTSPTTAIYKLGIYMLHRSVEYRSVFDQTGLVPTRMSSNRSNAAGSKPPKQSVAWPSTLSLYTSST